MDTRYYISSMPLDAARLNEIARVHRSLDVVFNEDKACIRNDNAAENIDILRKCALAILGKAKDRPDQSIKSLMRKNVMSFDLLLKTVDKIFHA